MHLSRGCEKSKFAYSRYRSTLNFWEKKDFQRRDIVRVSVWGWVFGLHIWSDMPYVLILDNLLGKELKQRGEDRVVNLWKRFVFKERQSLESNSNHTLRWNPDGHRWKPQSSAARDYINHKLPASAISKFPFRLEILEENNVRIGIIPLKEEQ